MGSTLMAVGAAGSIITSAYTVLFSPITVPSGYAADLIAKAPQQYVAQVPYYTWTGFYFGGNVGGTWGQKEWDWDAFTLSGFGRSDTLTFTPPIATTFPIGGFLGGAQAGYRMQIDKFVLGVEGSWDWTNTSGNVGCGFNMGIPTANCRSEGNWLATFTGQAGMTYDRALIYLKAGGAAISETHTVTPQSVTSSGGWGGGGGGGPSFTCSTCTSDETRLGLLVGAGVALAVADHWSLFMEYQHINFEDSTSTFAGTVGNSRYPLNFSTTVTMPQQLNVLIGGVNYKF